MTRLLPLVTAASWLLLPLAIPIRRIFEGRERGGSPARDRGGGPGLHRRRPRRGDPREGRGEAAPLDRGLRRHPRPRSDDAADRHRLDRRGRRRRRPRGPLHRRRSIRGSRGAGDDRHGRRDRARQGHCSRRSAPAVDARDRGDPARGLLRARVEESLRAPAGVPAAAPLDGDRRGRVRRRFGARDGRGPARGDRRRDLRRARGRARSRDPGRPRTPTPFPERRTSQTVRDLFGRGPEEEEFTTLGGFLATPARAHPPAGREPPGIGPALHGGGSGPPPRAQGADRVRGAVRPEAVRRT